MNAPEWQADITVTDDIAMCCIQSQFQELLPIKSFCCIGEGWDNKVYLVNAHIVFRFPRRKSAVKLIHQENLLLSILHTKTKISMKIPYPTYHGEPTEIYPYPFHGYEKIEGQAACYANLTEESRLNSITALTDFMMHLHHIDQQKANALGIRLQPVDRTDIPNVIKFFEKRIQSLVDKNCIDLQLDVVYQELILAEQIKLHHDNLCVVHGDLYCRHLIFHHDKLSGIIDWGDAGIGHRAVDLSVIWSFYPSTMHKTFLEKYGTVESHAWQYARFIALYVSFVILLYGLDISDKLLVKDSVESIRRINPNLLKNLTSW